MIKKNKRGLNWLPIFLICLVLAVIVFILVTMGIIKVYNPFYKRVGDCEKQGGSCIDREVCPSYAIRDDIKCAKDDIEEGKVCCMMGSFYD